MAQITQTAIGAALDARLQSFDGAGGDLNLEGSGYVPQAGRPYLSGRISAYVRTPLGIGPDTPCAVSGTYQISVHRPARGDIKLARSIAARLVLLFARGTPLSLANGQFNQFIILESASEQPAVTTGDWLTLPVTINWSATE